MAGKSPDDLIFKPDPPPEDVRKSEWYQFSEQIDDLIATGRYTWAEDTLTDIQETVQKYERVSEGQRRAVRNIEESSERSFASHTRRNRWRSFR